LYGGCLVFIWVGRYYSCTELKAQTMFVPQGWNRHPENLLLLPRFRTFSSMFASNLQSVSVSWVEAPRVTVPAPSLTGCNKIIKPNLRFIKREVRGLCSGIMPLTSQTRCINGYPLKIGPDSTL
jgi:hypothetical protein